MEHVGRPDVLRDVMKQEEPILVAIHCLVYNHEPYLRDCFEGFVMQKTNFRFVAIVHEDCSTDNSAAIIREYEAKYPDIFRPIYETENQYSKPDGSLGRIMNAAIDATGAKYIAMCEGDDYWIDPYKLQKQVDFLEKHQEYDLCCSASKVYNQSKQVFEKIKGSELCEAYETCIQGTNDINTASVLVRREVWNICLKEVSSFLPADLFFDTAWWYWFAYHKKTKYMPEPMAVYRVLANSACHTTDPNVEAWIQWRFLRLKLYFILRYPLRENQDEVTQCLIKEIEHHAAWNQHVGQLKVRQSRSYKYAKAIWRVISFQWLFNKN